MLVMMVVGRWTPSTWTGEVIGMFYLMMAVSLLMVMVVVGKQVDPIDLDSWRLFGDEGQHDQLKETGNDYGWWMMSW